MKKVNILKHSLAKDVKAKMILELTNISQTAEIIGIDRTTLSKILSCSRTPDLRSYILINHWLQLPFNYHYQIL